MGTIDVAIQDQATSPDFRKFCHVLQTHTLLAGTIPNSSIVYLSGTVTPGDELLVSGTSDTTLLGKVLSFSAPAVTLDRPVDISASQGSTVYNVTSNAAVDGSSVPKTFAIELPSGSTKEIDVTTIVLSLTCATEPDDSKFGDLAPLTKGVVLRSVFNNTVYSNLYNAKTNGEVKLVQDYYEYTDKAGGGYHGFTSITYLTARYGVVIRLTDGLRLEFVIQDNLSALQSLVLVARGHEVLP